MTIEEKTFVIASCLMCFIGMDMGGTEGMKFYLMGQICSITLLHKGDSLN
tara:strand:- start:3098 stop:3247 length:150 start_codon:yes stop_codon:yes gene_type:complete